MVDKQNKNKKGKDTKRVHGQFVLELDLGQILGAIDDLRNAQNDQ